MSRLDNDDSESELLLVSAGWESGRLTSDGSSRGFAALSARILDMMFARIASQTEPSDSLETGGSSMSFTRPTERLKTGSGASLSNLEKGS